MCLRRMDDIQLCKEISRLKTELQKLLSLPGKALGSFGEPHPAAARKYQQLREGSRPGMLPGKLLLSQSQNPQMGLPESPQDPLLGVSLPAVLPGSPSQPGLRGRGNWKENTIPLRRSVWYRRGRELREVTENPGTGGPQGTPQKGSLSHHTVEEAEGETPPKA